MKSTILVTGGAGYIGSHVSLLLAQKGYNVIVLDSLKHGQPFNHSWATLFKDDYGNIKKLNQIFSNYTVDAVMHCAASIEVGASVNDPLSFYDNNVSKTISLLQTMCTHNIKKFIFSSSCAIYGNPIVVPIKEDHPKNPISPYGKTKLMIEMALQDIQKAYGLQFVSLRYFNAAGALPDHGLSEWHKPETHLIPLLISALQKKTPFTIFGTDYQTQDGTCIRDFLHVWDIAHAHLKALEHLNEKKPSDCFNLGTGNGTSVKQIINMVQEIGNNTINVIKTEKRDGDPPMLIADPSRVHNILNWEPNYSEISFIIKTAWAGQTG